MTGSGSVLSALARITSFPTISYTSSLSRPYSPMAIPSKYAIFDRSRLRIKPLAERQHDLSVGHWLSLGEPTPPFEHPDLTVVSDRLANATGSRILIMGAHVLRAGVNRH